MTDINKLGDKFIQMVREGNSLHEGLCVLSDKIGEIESPQDLTLTKLNQILSLADIIESYAKYHANLINNSYMLIDFGKSNNRERIRD